jgi:hypothetical protein
MLFGSHDVRLARTQRRNHYYEWLAAVLLYHTGGYISLQKYEFPRASREKSTTLKRVLGTDACEWLYGRQRRRAVQCPDLLAFRPDLTEAFFVEAKGPTDRLRAVQETFFEELTERTGNPVKLITFYELPRAGGLTERPANLTLHPTPSASLARRSRRG